MLSKTSIEKLESLSSDDQKKVIDFLDFLICKNKKFNSKSRLAIECAKLNPKEEMNLAEEGMEKIK